jgi:divalent metal cation (Fe/Co/Zn/Cd) transporter
LAWIAWTLSVPAWPPGQISDFASEWAHLLADCRTSAVLVISLILSAWWHSDLIDPIAGVLVAISIVITGVTLVRSGCFDLMDTADPAIEKQIVEILDTETARRSVSTTKCVIATSRIPTGSISTWPSRLEFF